MKIQAGRYYVTKNGTPVYCEGRDAKYPGNWRVTILLYPNPYSYSSYLVFDDGSDAWHDQGRRIVAETTPPPLPRFRPTSRRGCTFDYATERYTHCDGHWRCLCSPDGDEE